MVVFSLFPQKNTGGLIFPQDDIAFIDVDPERVLFLDPQSAAQFDGDDNPAELIDFSDDACRLQPNPPLWLYHLLGKLY